MKCCWEGCGKDSFEDFDFCEDHVREHYGWSVRDQVAKECGWTPVSEGLPKKDWTDCFVLVPEIGGHYVTVEADFYNGKFYREACIGYNHGRTANIALEVDYWMEREPVPEYDDD